jgi:hypothetical protein
MFGHIDGLQRTKHAVFIDDIKLLAHGWSLLAFL